MPRFVMENTLEASREESDFVAAFIEALFWTNAATGVSSEEWFGAENQEAVAGGSTDGCIPGDVGYCDLHPDSLAAIRADCEAWQVENAELLALAYEREGYDSAQAGHDYFLTREGHGTGFWDRSALDADGLGDRLSDACRYREVHVFFGDHVEHGDAPFVHVHL